jgi:hypothetical protein
MRPCFDFGWIEAKHYFRWVSKKVSSNSIMTPQKFKEKWTDIKFPLVPLEPSRLQQFNLSESSIEFLIQSGFPKYADPNLSFIDNSDKKYNGISKINELFELFDKSSDYEKYVLIGYCNDGNVIAINTDEHDQIEELDNGDLFTPNFFNSSLNSLAGFLIIYRDFVNSVLSDKDPNDGMQLFNFTDTQFETLKEIMLHIDERAVMTDGFWKGELEGLLSNREQYFSFRS